MAATGPCEGCPMADFCAQKKPQEQQAVTDSYTELQHILTRMAMLTLFGEKLGQQAVRRLDELPPDPLPEEIGDVAEEYANLVHDRKFTAAFVSKQLAIKRIDAESYQFAIDRAKDTLIVIARIRPLIAGGCMLGPTHEPLPNQDKLVLICNAPGVAEQREALHTINQIYIDNMLDAQTRQDIINDTPLDQF